MIDDWTRAITFAPQDVDDERPVIMEEYRARLGASERITRRMLPMLFRGSPYADRLPIGLPEVIENAPAEKLENFYRKWYRPENMALVFVGDFNGRALEASLGDHFPSAFSPASPSGGKSESLGSFKRPRYDLPAPKKGSLETGFFTDSELPYTMVNLYFKRKPQARSGDLASYRAGVIDNLISRMVNLRFDDAASKPETPYVGAGAWESRYGYSSRFYAMGAQAKTGAAEASLRELFLAKESLLRHGFSAAEISQAKRSLLSDIERLVSEKDRQESPRFVQSLTNHFLKGETLPDLDWELEALRTLLPGIGEKDLAAAVKNYFADDDLTVFIIGPEDSDPINTSQIKRIASEARKARIEPSLSQELSGDLLEGLPEKGRILSETKDETGALIWDLENGARVILGETANRNNEIVFYALARGGSLSFGEERDISAHLAPEMLNVSGLGPYSRQDLIKKLMDKQVSFSFWASSFLRGFQGQSTTADIKTLFEMLYLSFTQPRFDPDAVKAMMDQYRTNLARQEDDPETAFSHEITRFIYGNSPRFNPLEIADLERVDTGKALNFVRRSLNPADYTFVFTGNIENETFRHLVETYLASLPQGTAWNQWLDVDIKRPGQVRKEMRKGKEERSAVYMAWFIPAAYSESLAAAASALNEYLDIRLTEEIREKLGGVYSISSWVSAGIVPRGEVSLGVYFICDPRRAEELSDAIEAQIRDIAASALNRDIFGKSLEALKKNHEQSIQSNSYIAQSYANSQVIYRVPLNRLTKRPSYYDAVKVQDIQALVKQILEGGPARFILYPENR